MEKKSRIQHHHISYLFIVVILLLIALAFTIKPAYTGYKLQKEFEELGENAPEILASVDKLRSENLIIETNLKNAETLNDDHLERIKEEKDNLFECINEKDSIKEQFEDLKSTQDSDLSILKLSHEELLSKYSAVTDTAANNICCKNKVDNPSIDSYTISENRIVCSTAQENKLSC